MKPISSTSSTRSSYIEAIKGEPRLPHHLLELIAEAFLVAFAQEFESADWPASSYYLQKIGGLLVIPLLAIRF